MFVLKICSLVHGLALSAFVRALPTMSSLEHAAWLIAILTWFLMSVLIFFPHPVQGN